MGRDNASSVLYAVLNALRRPARASRPGLAEEVCRLFSDAAGKLDHAQQSGMAAGSPCGGSMQCDTGMHDAHFVFVVRCGSRLSVGGGLVHRTI